VRDREEVASTHKSGAIRRFGFGSARSAPNQNTGRRRKIINLRTTINDLATNSLPQHSGGAAGWSLLSWSCTFHLAWLRYFFHDCHAVWQSDPELVPGD
jgi:hypothetical protein